MGTTYRFGISLDKDLLDKFDRLNAEKNYPNRSEAFRDLIRQELVKREWERGGEVAGSISIIYDHHHRAILDKIMNIQHDYHSVIISTQHIHLDHENCLEIIAVKGIPRTVKKLSDTLKAIKGVKHGTLSMTTTGKEVK